MEINKVGKNEKQTPTTWWKLFPLTCHFLLSSHHLYMSRQFNGLYQACDSKWWITLEVIGLNLAWGRSMNGDLLYSLGVVLGLLHLTLKSLHAFLSVLQYVLLFTVYFQSLVGGKVHPKQTPVLLAPYVKITATLSGFMSDKYLERLHHNMVYFSAPVPIQITRSYRQQFSCFLTMSYDIQCSSGVSSLTFLQKWCFFHVLRQMSVFYSVPVISI